MCGFFYGLLLYNSRFIGKRKLNLVFSFFTSVVFYFGILRITIASISISVIILLSILIIHNLLINEMIENLNF